MVPRARVPTTQLPLDLPVPPQYGAEDFLVSESNEAAFQLIEGWREWPDPVLVLVGPRASGKTHLAAIFAAWTGGRRLPAARLVADQVPDLVAMGAVALDDLDGAAGLNEAALFHLINLAQERAARVLITSAVPPSALAITTPDLASRLRRAVVAEIKPPDDALLAMLAVKLFHDRQMIIDVGVIGALIAQCERSFAGVADAVAALDRASLAAHRRITKAMVARALGGTAGEAGSDGAA
jgi:chromosomal replication initiation ATPase DnaA